MTETLPLRAAMEARDIDAVVAAFAPDAVVRSPITGRFAFTSRDQIRKVLTAVLESFDDLEYTDELRSGDSAVLVAKATVAGTPIEIVDHMRLAEDGSIREMTVFFRPMPAIAVAARLLGAALMRPEHPLRARVVGTLARPLGAIVRSGDAVADRLVLRRL